MPTVQHICESDTDVQTAPPTDDEVTLNPGDQESQWGALGFFPGNRSRGISLASASGEKSHF